MIDSISTIDTIDKFSVILGNLIRDKGVGILQSPQLKPLLGDYSLREYEKEVRLFLRIQAPLFAQRIMSTPDSDLDSLALSLVQFLQDEYLITPEAACLMIGALSSALHGTIPASITALLKELHKIAVPVATGGFVQIAPGSFVMGGYSRSSTRYNVTVDAFSIAQYPVTQSEFIAVMGYNPSYNLGTDFPVEGLSWYEAVEYCNSRSVYEGLSPVYIIDKTNEAPSHTVLKGGEDPFNWIISEDSLANGYRLPSQAEWEFACRAGTTTDYNTGDHRTLPVSAARMKANCPSPVGTYPPNGWGLYDMHGNINEWCSDRTDKGRCYYRGGSYADKPNAMRSWNDGYPQRPWRMGSPAFIWSTGYTEPNGGFIGPYGMRLVKN